MTENAYPTFYPQIKQNSFNSNINSLSKSNFAEKNNISNNDYKDILYQIRSKKKFLNNPLLLQNFFFQNNKQKQSFIKHQFINQNMKTLNPLLTEPSYNKKYLSFKKFPKNMTLSYSPNKNKSKLTSPKMQINKIIKFENEKKFIKTIKISKKIVPMELSTSYKNFIEKMNKSKFWENTNSDTDYAHNIRSKFFVYKLNESLKREKKRNDKYLKREKEKMEDYSELRDRVLYPSMEYLKLSKKIKSILGNQNKFSQSEKREKFFDSFTNRINFLYDNFKPPSIKNNLIKIKFDDMYNDKELHLIYRIGNASINYLANAKIRIQRERDEKEKFMREKSKIAKKYKFYKKLSSRHIYNSKEEIEKIIYKDYYTKNDEDILESERENLNLEENLEKKNYFENKMDKFGNVSIAEPKLRKFLFENFNFKKKCDKLLKL